MSATNAETIGFLEQLIQLMQDNSADLKTKGLDVTNWITEMNDLKNDAVTKSTEQDNLQAALKVKTKESQTANKLAYDAGSTRLDAIVGVLGKSTPLAKQAARLRSGIIRQSRKKTDNKTSA